MKINKTLLLLSICVLTLGCSKMEKTELKPGFLRGQIEMQNKSLPFLLEFKGNPVNQIKLYNEGEVIELPGFKIQGDTLDIPLHIFDINLKAKITPTGLEGWYIKNYAKDYKLPFTATYGNNRRVDQKTSTDKMNGTYEVNFHQEDGSNKPAIGVFQRKGDIMTGTFLTPTGDYRYLEGFADDNQMTLYTFDGNHAYIFEAERSDDGRIHGEFFSGRSWNQTWDATPNPEASLEDANKMTYLKPGYDGIDFSFPDLNGNLVSPSDAKFENKVLVLQIFGTWCPNCMDETRFYKEWIEKNPNAPVSFLGLAYESKDDFEYAKKRVSVMKEKMNVPYDFVIAGVSDKKKASKTLPMLNSVLSFPTTIFIDKKGEVRKIHTGFSGPATGKYYTNYVEEFNAFMNQLITE